MPRRSHRAEAKSAPRAGSPPLHEPWAVSIHMLGLWMRLEGRGLLTVTQLKKGFTGGKQMPPI